ncbi:MAG TPA: hypothetical protein VK629_05725 [Steroidobacteraceae bacterium]|nr:hypothetical protein [Steroidobacteraceae bacterium]
MGYTHYWAQKKDLTKEEWAELCEGASAMFTGLMLGDIKLAHESDETDKPPTVSGTTICFNGVGQEGHETFLITRKRDKEDRYTYCKTDEKPYDVAVAAILAYLDSVHPDKWGTSSDGRTDEWEAGVKLARLSWPKKANIINTPRAVINTSRYAYYLHSSKTYQIAQGHDGVTYIERHKDLWRIALPLTQEEMRARESSAPYKARTSGSFSGDEYEKCKAAFCKSVWDDFADKAVPPDTFKPLPA